MDDDERAKFDLGCQGDALIINEPGLYSVILRSDKPETKSFKRWITHEVIPAIRKTGSYGVKRNRLSIKPAQNPLFGRVAFWEKLCYPVYGATSKGKREGPLGCDRGRVLCPLIFGKGG